MNKPNVSCFKEFGSKSECPVCPVRSSCEKVYNKIVHRNKEWDYTKYREVLDKKFNLENENLELFKKQLLVKSEVLSLGHRMEKNNNLIFKYNNDARKQMGYGIITVTRRVEKETKAEENIE